MIYSKFTDNQEDNEETTLVSSSAAPNPQIKTQTSTETTSEEAPMSLSVERLSSVLGIRTHVHIIPQPSVSVDSQCHAEVPYINRAHLKTLDTSNLERNIQVRHDLMIEEGYRANLPRLNLSEQEEEKYWNSIRAEVTDLQLQSDNDATRLRGLLSEIREMMIDLYPRCDVVTGEFAEFLEDTKFIVQQLKLGSLDIQNFFLFLGHVMKKNCAPKRDVLVDAMSSCSCPIDGLKAALKLIELMKLDLANFKLDQLRPLIAKTAVSTERAFFSQLFSSKKISLDLTTKWIRSQSNVNEGSTAHDVFLNVSIRLLVSPFVKDSNCNVPETFILDKKRLLSLHGRFQDLCIVQCLLLIFKQSASMANSLNKRKCFAATMLKGELLRLLEQPDTQISDISNLLIQSLKDSQIDIINFDYIHSALNNIISPDNELFLLIEGKLLNRIKTKLSGKSLPPSDNGGLSELNVLEEFDELIKKFGILLQYNWNVFEPIYQNLLNPENKQ